MGRAAVFLRLADCNLRCSWCDTRYSWDWTTNDRSLEVSSLPVSDVIGQLMGLRILHTDRVIITGGEPLLQRAELINMLMALRFVWPEVRVEIETNGTIPPGDRLADLVDLFVVSPKLSNSGDQPKTRLRNLALADFAAREYAEFKFVVLKAVELEEIEQIRLGLKLSPARIWVMPEGDTTDGQLLGMKRLVESVRASGYNFSPRLHALIWGDERGR
jgi:7-carboxy-7-deazaguanine synthase